ncbi:phenylacetate--CoA ligase family protein [Sulfobacillus harzensis]|uniref:Phenylacetate-coenzyme A ligase n=1 Tax=Sulfobacillus harzensis TaxID=2729629 RepID=A0A7Y0L0R8_9FIRM|nr:phenylacetate--CoA ligase [Sulfobacillus harzensis]NMP21194.1 phenylacetate--CoA ligase [Sulfobacillus harzensis]
MIWDREMETLDRSRLRELQRTRLAWTFDWARERVPFYRGRLPQMAHLDTHAEEVLRELPFTKKSDLRDNYPLGLLAVPKEQVRRFHASSGTRGKPTVVAYTQNDLDNWAEVVARSLAAAGMRPGQTLQNAYGYGLFTGGLGLHAGAERLGVAVIPASGGQTDRQVQMIMDLEPDGLSCTPSYALFVAETMEKMGIDPADTSLKTGIFGAEPWSDGLRKRLEEALHIQAVDIYGLSEITGPGVAIECVDGKNGLHVFEDFFYVEVINPNTLEPVAPGEVGELVLTTLTKEAMPMIRYRTGDLVSVNPEPCVCGRTSVRISRIHGRSDDMLIVHGVNVFPSEIERVLLSHPAVSGHYQLVWEGTPARRDLVVELESRALTEEMGHQLESQLSRSLGVKLGLRVVAEGTVPRSQGKAVRVIDRVGQ